MTGLVRMLGLAAVVAGLTFIASAAAEPAKARPDDVCAPAPGSKSGERTPEEVIEQCTAALKAVSTDRDQLAAYYNNRSNGCVDLGKYELALADLREAMRLQPFNPIPFVNSALLKMRLGRIEEALSDINSAIRCDPHHSKSYIIRGDIYFSKRDFDRAMKDYDLGVREGQDYGTAYATRCFARAVIGKDIPGAKKDCDTAIKLSPNDVNPVAYRGLVEFRLGEFDKAVKDCTIAIDKPHPGVTKDRAYFIRSLAKARLGDAEGATADRDEAVRRTPDIAEEFEGVS